MLLDSAGNIIGEPNVKFSLAILNDVNAISCRHAARENWLRGRDLNPRPSGYEPDELPGCSTPRLEIHYAELAIKSKSKISVQKVSARKILSAQHWKRRTCCRMARGQDIRSARAGEWSSVAQW